MMCGAWSFSRIVQDCTSPHRHGLSLAAARAMYDGVRVAVRVRVVSYIIAGPGPDIDLRLSWAGVGP